MGRSPDLSNGPGFGNREGTRPPAPGALSFVFVAPPSGELVSRRLGNTQAQEARPSSCVRPQGMRPRLAPRPGAPPQGNSEGREGPLGRKGQGQILGRGKGPGPGICFLQKRMERSVSVPRAWRAARNSAIIPGCRPRLRVPGDQGKRLRDGFGA